ncbi:MAG: hypothetical protein AAF960_14875 [Bacteroidota bacterium]
MLAEEEIPTRLAAVQQAITMFNKALEVVKNERERHVTLERLKRVRKM